MADQEVSSIGVRLTLDASSFLDGMKAANAELNAFQQQAEKAGSGVGQMTAGGGAPTSRSSSARGKQGTGTGVPVDITVSPESLANLRQQISKGLGAIPVAISF